MPNARSPLPEISRASSPDGVILFDSSLLPQATPRMREVASWSQARPFDGGRGAAFLVRGEFGEGVLRHYRRGGLIRHLVADRYLFLGESRLRCVREFCLLLELHRRGLPVPRPVLAGWRREGLLYRADLVTRRLPDARTLAEHLQDPPGSIPWQEIGATIGRFHAAGVFHADLNAHNVMIDGQGRVWLLDFDRGRLRNPAPRWQQANLRRLQRSLEKLGGIDAADWQAVLDGHRQGLAMQLEAGAH